MPCWEAMKRAQPRSRYVLLSGNVCNERIMKIVNIIDGLGNQMFQYAFAIALQHQYPEEDVFIDISHFQGYLLHSGFELQRIFNVQLPNSKTSPVDAINILYPSLCFIESVS